MFNSPRYRQAGYGWLGDDWRAVWLDSESLCTGNLLFVIYPDRYGAVPYTGTIYRTLRDMPKRG